MCILFLLFSCFIGRGIGEEHEELPGYIMDIPKWGGLDVHWWLKRGEDKVFSQNKEDGFLDALLALVEDTHGAPVPRTYAEFGAEDGLECNTRYLREYRGWEGVLLDGGHEDAGRNLHKAFVTPDNINALLLRFGVAPGVLGVLSIDLDYYDFYVWRAILTEGTFRPVVVIVEYNSSIRPEEALVVPFTDESDSWDMDTHFYGASLRAMVLLGRRHGYEFVGCETSGTNAFFIDGRWRHTTAAVSVDATEGPAAAAAAAAAPTAATAAATPAAASAAADSVGESGGQPKTLREKFLAANRVLPTVERGYVRAAYTDSPPGSMAEYDRQLAIDVTVDGQERWLECPLAEDEDEKGGVVVGATVKWQTLTQAVMSGVTRERDRQQRKRQRQQRQLFDCARKFASEHGLKHQDPGCASADGSDCAAELIAASLHKRRWLRVDEDGALESEELAPAANTTHNPAGSRRGPRPPVHPAPEKRTRRKEKKQKKEQEIGKREITE